MRTISENQKLTFMILSVVAVAMIFLFGCSPVAKNPTSISELPPVQTQNPDQYQIQVGDELDIKSFFNPELNEKVSVRPDGKVSLQLANDITAAGHTVGQLGDELKKRYATYFRQPDVTVIVRSFSSQKVYVGGHVRKPGIVPITGTLTVLQAVAAAEGFTGAARVSEVIVIRKNGDNTPFVVPLNLKLAISGEDMKQDILLQPFDIVHVPSTSIANVTNAVGSILRSVPSPIALSYRMNDQ